MSTLYQHFRPEERGFIDQVVEWKEQVESQYAQKRTDFLDPREQHILLSIIGTEGSVRVAFFPKTGERKRALIYPDYYEPSEEDYGICLYEIHYPAKFVTIEHRQILGTLMSLGLKREKFGDIPTEGERYQLVAADEISGYLEMELQQIGKARVSLEKRQMAELFITDEKWSENTTTVSSLRLDVILSAIQGVSRQKAQALIKASLVKVNWRGTESTSFEVEEGDVISTRGFGRSKLLTIDGKTKRDKWRITFGVLK